MVRVRREAQEKLVLKGRLAWHPAGRAGQDLRHVLSGERSARRAVRPPAPARWRSPKRLAQSMGGDITVRSEQGHGSCFTLTIKAPAVQEAPSARRWRKRSRVAGAAHPAGGRYRTERDRGAPGAEKLGNSVEVAMNGHDALAMFDPDEFDLVLLTSNCRT